MVLLRACALVDWNAVGRREKALYSPDRVGRFGTRVGRFKSSVTNIKKISHFIFPFFIIDV